MKLNLGCDEDFRSGWLNVDVRPVHPEGPEFLVSDLLDLEERLEPGCAEEIAAVNVLEFLSWRHVDAALVVFWKLLRPGGRLFVRVPDFSAATQAFADGTCSPETVQRLVLGSQGHADACQRSLWSEPLVRARLAMVGLVVERIERDDLQLAVWASGGGREAGLRTRYQPGTRGAVFRQ